MGRRVRPRVEANGMRVTFGEAVGVGAACSAAAFFTNDWIGGAAALVLWLIWKLLDTGDRLYILPLAMTFQWTQTSIGVFYVSLFGRHMATVDQSDYRPMVVIGLGCCLAIAVGLRLGLTLIKR